MTAVWGWRYAAINTYIENVLNSITPYTFKQTEIEEQIESKAD
jgi:hypothetical protein